MKIEINKLTSEKIETRFLKKVVERVLKILPRVPRGIEELSIAIAGNRQMMVLNKKYRGENRITDVLAFDYGEIIICLPQARRQAKELGHSLKEELKTLLIHGVLHLAGYNDETKESRLKMLKKQEEICQRII